MHLDSTQIDRTKLENKTLIEYFSMKDDNPDYIIIYQVGTFWETWFEDAKILSSLSGMTLSARYFKHFGDVAQCGFTDKSNINMHIKTLLEHGYKVCICEEYKDENNKSKRRVQRKYTQGTIFENEFLETSENNYIAALYYKENNISLAYADASTGQFYKTNGQYEEIKIELEKIEPNELLILNSQQELLKEIIKKYNTTILGESFNSENPESIIEKYCKHTQKKFCAELDKIIKYETANYVMMDEITRKNLELTKTKMYSKRKGSLFWFLKNTKTSMGTRLLKKFLSEPLLSIEKIKQRQDAVEELIKNKTLLDKLIKNLQEFCDLSRICAKISNSTITPKELYRIAQNSKALHNLKSNTINLNSDLLKLDCEKLNEVLALTEEIIKAIKENASDKTTEGNIIKENYDANLDYLKNELQEYESQLIAYEYKERKRLDIDKLKITSSGTIGFYIEIPNSKTQKVPQDYYRKQALRDCTRYTTQKLAMLEQNIFNLTHKINQYEHELYCNIRNKAKNFVEIIRDLAKEIARIDVIASLAKCAIDNNFIRPKFNKEEINITNGYHPSLIKLKNEIIKNDSQIKNGSMIILTGANMSGKSTFLKFNAIICLLAQIGAYVPADYANLTITDKLFLRQGATDDIINNNSSFMVEMNDMKFIIDNLTDSSFILLDEPAKSTNANEGGAIARAFCEYILNHSKAKTIIVTHNLELTKIEKLFPNNAHNYVIGNPNTSTPIINDRKIRKGSIQSSFAINTALLANLPLEIINNAEKYAQI